MKPTPSFRASAESRFARSIAIARDSITQGPAMNVSSPPPNETPLSTAIFFIRVLYQKRRAPVRWTDVRHGGARPVGPARAQAPGRRRDQPFAFSKSRMNWTSASTPSIGNAL